VSDFGLAAILGSCVVCVLLGWFMVLDLERRDRHK
jgi:hypothetical protein